MKDINKLQKKIGYAFLDYDLLWTALTHSSYVNEQKSKEKAKENALKTLPHNERLEFLGDAVLEIAISEELYKRYPHEREGLLTHTRSNLVNENTLASLAKELDLDTFLLLGKGEESQGGRQRPSILSDAFEALLAAIYLDAKKNPHYKDPAKPINDLINLLYQNLWPQDLKPKEKKDYKTLLQELTQTLFKDAPKYALIASEGPEHQKSFTVELVLPNQVRIQKTAHNKKRAEQDAACEAYDLLSKSFERQI